MAEARTSRQPQVHNSAQLETPRRNEGVVACGCFSYLPAGAQLPSPSEGLAPLLQVGPLKSWIVERFRLADMLLHAFAFLRSSGSLST